jgi:hypothetical protein
MILDRLITGPTSPHTHNGIEIPLPDSDHWDDVDFILVPSVLSIQFGEEDDFHGILGGFLVHVPNNGQPGACARSFEKWAGDWLDAFDTNYEKGRKWSSSGWMRPAWPGEKVEQPSFMEGGDVLGKVATAVAHGTYECAYAAYPAWKDTCLVLGVAIPSRDEDTRARALRDRFARELFPNVKVTTSTPPSEERH